MTHIGTILILLAPAVLATGLHARLMPLPEKRTPLALFGLGVLYAFAIAYLLSCAKFVRGKAAIPLADSFDTVKNVVVYGPVAMVLGAALPFCARFARRVRGSRLFARRAQKAVVPTPDVPAAVKRANAPAPGQPATPDEAASKAASDEMRTRRTEASLAAQEAEMVAAHARVVPRRKADGAPSQTLFNIGTRDTNAVKKTLRQRLLWVLVYVTLALLSCAIIYLILTSPNVS